ncbi:hypothetical protein A9G24_07735 [Gilliamella sp. App6-5]|uniref:hypothetical protein n=2 Tax=Gilliamella sp. App6-5 TaxID=3120232 RepID=UPI00080E0FB5|nr:hypothetical protein [Gilliamella apicola]OCG13307.1 hypothetical protein A9G24_07735 [Gilliamella apicola]
MERQFKDQLPYVLNLPDKHVRRVFTLSSKLLSKILRALAPLLLLPYSLGLQALSAKTTDIIQGTAPYLTFDSGRTKVTTTEDLLSIRLSDGTQITPSNNPSTPTSPITLPNAGDTLADIDMMIPVSRNSILLSDLVTRYHYWGDDDGDGLGTKGVIATGSLSIKITDKNNREINRNDALDICKAPYKMELNNMAGSLSTQYGVPSYSIFDYGTATYYINPNLPSTVCYARPNLQHGTGSFKGPDSIWDSDKGFIPQSTNPTLYGSNFPTTGADGLYFDLDIRGIDPNQLTWQPVTHEGITATVTRTIANDNWISDHPEVVTRVTLTGPEARAQKDNVNPSRISKPNLPKTFELVGKDSDGNVVVKYGFVLRKWFINRGDKSDTASNQVAWCRSLGYRLAQVKDLTNAVCFGLNSGNYCQDAIGATPSASDNFYQRQIGAGFFTEWDQIFDYAGIDFTLWYWTSDTTGNLQFYVGVMGGGVDSYNPSYHYSGLCTTP